MLDKHHQSLGAIIKKHIINEFFWSGTTNLCGSEKVRLVSTYYLTFGISEFGIRNQTQSSDSFRTDLFSLNVY